MAGRSMNWGAPTSSEIAYPDNESEIFRMITGVSLFGNTEELDLWLNYNGCCMSEGEPEKMTKA